MSKSQRWVNDDQTSVNRVSTRSKCGQNARVKRSGQRVNGSNLDGDVTCDVMATSADCWASTCRTRVDPSRVRYGLDGLHENTWTLWRTRAPNSAFLGFYKGPFPFYFFIFFAFPLSLKLRPFFSRERRSPFSLKTRSSVASDRRSSPRPTVLAIGAKMLSLAP